MTVVKVDFWSDTNYLKCCKKIIRITNFYSNLLFIVNNQLSSSINLCLVRRRNFFKIKFFFIFKNLFNVTDWTFNGNFCNYSVFLLSNTWTFSLKNKYKLVSIMENSKKIYFSKKTKLKFLLIQSWIEFQCIRENTIIIMLKKVATWWIIFFCICILSKYIK